MSRNRGRASSPPLPAPPSDDIGWTFAIPTKEKNRVICKLCDKSVTGGITRLKEHLAGVRGNVTSCTKASEQLQREMTNLIKGKKEAKSVTRRKRDEVQERLRMGDDANYESGEDQDMTIAMRESLRSQHEYEQRQMRASGSHRGQAMNLDTPEARIASMEPSLERSKSAKQTKLSTLNMGKRVRKLGEAISRFTLYAGLPTRVTQSLHFKPMLDTAAEVGKNVKLPTCYEITGVYLDNEFKLMKEWVGGFRRMWAERGVTIMCDGWTDINRKHLINFMIYCPRGTIFHKSIDASAVNSRDTNFYFRIMDQVVEEIGEENVVQVVTDNEAAVKAGGRLLMGKRQHLYWAPCSAHCLDLILQDIGQKQNVKNVLAEAKTITSFIYNYTWTISYMKKFTKDRELLRPAVTRFATNFIALQSILRHKVALREMVHSRQWRSSKYSKLAGGITATETILNSSFWQKASDVCKILEPLVRVLKLCDGDEKPTMGFIYEAMDRAKLAIKENSRYYQQYWRIIDQRWANLLHHDLHSAGYYFNPQWQYGNSSENVRKETKEGTKNVIQRLEPSIEKQIKAMNQLFPYEQKESSFGTVIAQRSIEKTNPAEWWLLHGGCAPELQDIAVKVLSQTTSATNCERNWSTFGHIHTKKRNRLKCKKLQKMVYVHYNMKLKIRNMERRSDIEMERDFTPINLDYIFEEDPMATWIEEREDPLMDGQEFPGDLLEDTEDENEGLNEVENDIDDGENILVDEVDEVGGGLSSPSNNDDASSSGNGSGNGNMGGYENEQEQSYQPTSHYGQPRTRMPDDHSTAYTGAQEPSVSLTRQGKSGGRTNRTHLEIVSEDSSPSQNDMTGNFGFGNYANSESSSQTSHNYQPQHYGHGYYPPSGPSYTPGYDQSLYGVNSTVGASWLWNSDATQLYGQQQQQTEEQQGWNYGQNLQHGEESGSNYGHERSSDNLYDPPRHSFWY